ncbi:hypothetical protein [Fodinibius salsisoli]|uniref:Carboxypeptidase regulatory-like domain-containing protein n=1 Tax=Fodinibius salsisoli TaxID=2820877 RepID=A0ABT3PRL5_9BACT|nr:hypothetical protein [Fodinibius salsisoli]MCW9708505.1 hypothetical protein [Fodinibius salsisoli]
MKTNYYSITLIFALCIVTLQACSDNSSGSEGGEKVEVTGTIQAPDGSTPLAGATVFIPKGGANKAIASKAKASPLATTMEGECPEPAESYAAFTCTNADGSFTFNIPVSGSSVTLKITKGIFSFEQNININDSDGTLGEIVMPSTQESLDGEVAVVEGSYDRMQDILAKVGFGEVGTDEANFNYGRLVPGTEQFDIYNYTSKLFEDADGDGQKDLFNYDIIFINCGASESPLNEKVSTHTHSHLHAKSSDGAALLSTEDRTALKDFVESGGILYTTDWAYDYIEQVFPSYIDYYGSDDTPADEPEGENFAQSGNAGIETDGLILQPNMESWLANVDCFDGESCLNADNTVHITDFLGGWAVIDGPHASADVTQWVEGNVEWGGESGVRPLTVSFQAGDGSVFYSSYHTVESEHTPNWRPQERLLQYLVFE